MRKVALLEAAAYNTGRLNGRADLLAMVSPERLDQRQGVLSFNWEEQIGAGGEVSVMPGPMPFEVLDVTVSDSGRAASIEVCAVSGRSTSSADLPDSVMSDTAGSLRKWDFALDDADDIRLVREAAWRRESTGGWCEISDVHYGLFDPQPVRPIEVPVVERWRPDTDGSSADTEELMDRYEELRDLAEEAAQG